MNLEACIAHAIHSELDIIEALPEVQALPMEELEDYIEHYVTSIHNDIFDTVCTHGEDFIRCKDSAGLCATLQSNGVKLPPTMLLKMCQTIMELSQMDATFILDTDDGSSLYHVKMEVDVNEEPVLA